MMAQNPTFGFPTPNEPASCQAGVFPSRTECYVELIAAANPFVDSLRQPLGNRALGKLLPIREIRPSS